MIRGMSSKRSAIRAEGSARGVRARATLGCLLVSAFPVAACAAGIEGLGTSPILAGRAFDIGALRRELAGTPDGEARGYLSLPDPAMQGFSETPTARPTPSPWNLAPGGSVAGTERRGMSRETGEPRLEVLGDMRSRNQGLSGVVQGFVEWVSGWQPVVEGGASFSDSGGPAPEACLAPMAEAASTSPMAPLSAGPGITLGLGNGEPIRLLPGLAGQVIDLYLRNDGAAVSVGGLDLKIGVTGAGAPGPVLGGVDLRAGLLFTAGNAVQGADAANTGSLQFWSVSINDPSSPPSLNGGGSSTKVGTVSISTVGLTGGTWSLSAILPDTAVVDPFGDMLSLAVTDGTLEVVPEATTTALASGLALLGWAWGRRRART